MNTGGDPRITMAANGFAKYLEKSPPDDDDIREAMEWVRAMVTQVLDEPVSASQCMCGTAPCPVHAQALDAPVSDPNYICICHTTGPLADCPVHPFTEQQVEEMDRAYSLAGEDIA